MKTLMIVYNSLETDARVRRSAEALAELGEVKLIGIDKNGVFDTVDSEVILLKSKHNIIRYFEFIYKIKKCIRKLDFDLFFANDFYCAELIPWVRRRNKKVHVVYDAHELYVPQDDQPLNKRFEFFYKKERRAIKEADLVICANKERAGIMKEHFRLNDLPLVIRNISQLPSIVDSNSKDYENATDAFFKLPGITLVYAGVLTAARKIEALIEIAEKEKNTKLLIIGNGPYKSDLEQRARKSLGERVLFTGGIPYTYLSILLSKCDIGYLFYPTDILNNIYCAPNKIYEYSSVRLPMIANDNPTVKKILMDSGIGVASDDLLYAYRTVAKDLEGFKNRCDTFNRNNRWEHEKRVLIRSIEGLK